MFGSGDLDVFFADMGVICVAGGQTATVLLDAPGEGIDLSSLAQVSGVDYAITYKTSALSLMTTRMQITVDGVRYQVTSIDPLDDGQISKAKLKKL